MPAMKRAANERSDGRMDTEGNVFEDQMTEEVEQGMQDCADSWEGHGRQD